MLRSPASRSVPCTVLPLQCPAPPTACRWAVEPRQIASAATAVLPSALASTLTMFQWIARLSTQGKCDCLILVIVEFYPPVRLFQGFIWDFSTFCYISLLSSYSLWQFFHITFIFYSSQQKDHFSASDHRLYFCK